MGNKPPGITCSEKFGADWVDAGTLCRNQSNAPAVAGLRTDQNLRDAWSETAPLQQAEKNNRNVSIEFERRDLSIGKARYTGANQISPNLASKPTIRGRPNDFIAHANVEVHLYDDSGNEVPMSLRLVRYWSVMPVNNAIVENLNQWRIVGLEQSEFLPFAESKGEQPASRNFEWDRSSVEDAPGVQGSADNLKSFGQLQEFLIGNPKAGGAYYQIYTLEDEAKVRVISTNALKLTAKEFRETVQMIKSGDYSKSMQRKLFFMPAGGHDSITPYPQPVRK